MFEEKKNWREELLKIIKFGLTGGLNTLIDLLLFALLAQVLGVNYYLSKTISYTAGMLNSYLVNRKWTFQTHERFFSAQMVRFIVTNLLILGISMGLLTVLIDDLKMMPAIANLAATMITLIINFLISRFWVFK